MGPLLAGGPLAQFVGPLAVNDAGSDRIEDLDLEVRLDLFE